MRSTSAVQALFLSTLVVSPALADSHDQYDGLGDSHVGEILEYRAMAHPKCPADHSLCPANTDSCSKPRCVNCAFFAATCCTGTSSDPAACVHPAAAVSVSSTTPTLTAATEIVVTAPAGGTKPTLAVGWIPVARDEEDDGDSDDSPDAAATVDLSNDAMPTLAVGPEMGAHELAAASAASLADERAAEAATATATDGGAEETAPAAATTEAPDAMTTGDEAPADAATSEMESPAVTDSAAASEPAQATASAAATEAPAASSTPAASSGAAGRLQGNVEMAVGLAALAVAMAAALAF